MTGKRRALAFYFSGARVRHPLNPSDSETQERKKERKKESVASGRALKLKNGVDPAQLGLSRKKIGMHQLTQTFDICY